MTMDQNSVAGRGPTPSEPARRRKKLNPPWDSHDYALWFTCELVATLVDGAPDRTDLPQLLTPFPMQLSDDERAIAGCSFRRLVWGATGDGTYTHNSGFFFATGAIGLALTAGAAAGRAARNSARKRQAAAGLEPRWLETDAGALYVTTHGFYMQDQEGLFAWGWDSITSAQVANGLVELSGESTSGPTTFALAADYAELVFVLWALARHPSHPQLLEGSWLPYNWLRRADDAGYPSRLSRYQIGSR